MTKRKEVRLRDLCILITKGTTPTTLGYKFVDRGINFIKSEAVTTDGRIDGSKFVFIDESANRALKRSILAEGDILFSMAGMAIGKTAVVPRDVLPANTNQALGLIRLDRSKADPQFIDYFLRNHTYNQFINNLVAQSAQPNLNLAEIGNLPITLPPLSEQRTIAKTLGSLDDKIELNRRMSETSEAAARAMFKSWFVDFDPVRAKAENLQPYGLDAKTAALFPDSFEDSPLGKIPHGWSVSDLPDAIDFLEGPGLRNWQYRLEGIRFLNIRCIENGDLYLEKANYVSEEEFESKYSHFALKEDDIVISTSGTLGRLAIVREDHLPVMLNTSIIRMRGRNAIGLCYLWATLQSEYFLEEMFALASGSVQLNFGPMHLRRMKILRPPDEILTRFDQLVSPLIRLALANRKECRTLATTRDTLLPMLISGEVLLRTQRS